MGKINLPVLCVDLDETLIKSDLLYESLCIYLKQNPFKIFKVFLALKNGRASVKRLIANSVKINPESLPYNKKLISFLKKEKSKGRKLVLATASDKILVEPIFNYLEIFDEFYATDNDHNLKGDNKLKLLEEKFGEKGFDYIGDSKADFSIWEKSANSYVVSDNPEITDKVKEIGNLKKVFSSGLNPKLTFLRAIRVQQWVKNLLLFVPIFMAQQFLDIDLIFKLIFAFISFSLLASTVYLLNDLTDLESDRLHRFKKFRPLAAGDFQIKKAFLTIPVFTIISLFIALIIGFKFFQILIIYFILTTIYSLYLKQLAVVDIIMLASLYTIRILAGGIAVGVPVSTWLLAFSMFFFLGLACVKRFSELISLPKGKRTNLLGRGYKSADLTPVGQFGTTSSYLSVLILALYISSDEVLALYSHPLLLWLMCPVILLWVTRVWLLAYRKALHEDPIVFAIRDKFSYFLGFACILILILAS